MPPGKGYGKRKVGNGMKKRSPGANRGPRRVKPWEGRTFTGGPVRAKKRSR